MTTTINRFTILCLACVLLFSCNDEKKYLFLGHIYSYEDTLNQLDPRIEKIDFDNYDGIWLGGDLLFYGMRDKASLTYLDSVFNFKSRNVHWALGNHDVVGAYKDSISSVTNNPSYYATYENKITIITLNTTLSNHNCKKLNEQLGFFMHVCDTLDQTQLLVVLSHHFVWGNLDTNTAKFANGNMAGWRTSCRNGDIFDNTMFPKLQDVQKSRQVLWIAGDTGLRKKGEYSYKTAEGIIFLASGIAHSAELKYGTTYKPKDEILTITYSPSKDELKWNFVEFDSYIKNL